MGDYCEYVGNTIQCHAIHSNWLAVLVDIGFNITTIYLITVVVLLIWKIARLIYAYNIEIDRTGHIENMKELENNNGNSPANS